MPQFGILSMLIILSWRLKGGGHGPMPPLTTPQCLIKKSLKHMEHATTEKKEILEQECLITTK